MKKVQEKLIVFCIALIIAFTLWYSIKLGYRYTIALNIPLQYTNFPEQIKLKKNPPESVSAIVNGRGDQLLLYWLGFKVDTAYINMSQQYNKRYLLANQITYTVTKSLPSNTNLLSIQPDTLYFDYEAKKKRKVPVRSMLKIKPQNGYLLEEKVKIKPDSVTLIGLGEEIAHYQDWSTQPIEYDNIVGSQVLKVPMSKLDNMIVSPAEVEANAKVLRYTEGMQTVPIQIEGVPYHHSLRLLPKTVTVKYLVPLERYEEVSEKDIQVIVRYKDTDVASSYLVPIIKKVPPFIRGVRFEPAHLRYVVSKK